MKAQKRRFARKLTIMLLVALAAACSVEGENGAQEGGVRYCWTYDTETGDVAIEVKDPFAGGEVYEYDANGNVVGSHQFSGAATSFPCRARHRAWLFG